MNSLKGKFSMCPTQLINPKHASLKDDIQNDLVYLCFKNI